MEKKPDLTKYSEMVWSWLGGYQLDGLPPTPMELRMFLTAIGNTTRNSELRYIASQSEMVEKLLNQAMGANTQDDDDLEEEEEEEEEEE